MKKKVLLSSILTIALCLSLIAGSTFALFTSTDEVNVSVNAGKVEMVAGVAITKVESVLPNGSGTITDEFGGKYSYGHVDTAAPFDFANLGNAVINGNTLTLNKITPGDKVTFAVSGTNGSDVTIQYRYIIECTGGYQLMSGLVLDVAGTAYNAVASYTSAWTTLTEGQNTGDIVLSLELPVNAGNEYQEQTTDIKITVEAVQGNAATSGGVTVEYLDTAEDEADLATLLKANEKNIDVILSDDVNLPISSLGPAASGAVYQLGGADTETVTVDLNGKTLNLTTTYWSVLGATNPNAVITFKNGTLTSSQTSGTWDSYDLRFASGNFVFEDVTFEKAIALSTDATLKNVTINETHDYYALWITAEGHNITIDGLTVNSAGRGIKIDEQYVGTPEKVTLTVHNATFNTVSKSAIIVKTAAGADIYVDNIDITNVAADSTNAVWVDEDGAAYAHLVTVVGGLMIVEP